MPGLELVAIGGIDRILELLFHQFSTIRQVIITAIAQAGNTERAIKGTARVITECAHTVTFRITCCSDPTQLIRLRILDESLRQRVGGLNDIFAPWEQHAAETLPLLTDPEQAVYQASKRNAWGQNVRLEQERIAWDVAWKVLQQAI